MATFVIHLIQSTFNSEGDTFISVLLYQAAWDNHNCAYVYLPVAHCYNHVNKITHLFNEKSTRTLLVEKKG